MTRLIWDAVGSRFYETGLDRAVLYPPTGPGVPWNGLVSADIGAENVVTSPIYYDGVKTFDLVDPGDFSGSISAVTYPDEFMDCDGSDAYGRGVFLDNQRPKPFGLSYRTLIASDSSASLGYKLHVIYGLTAIPDTVSNRSLSGNAEPLVFSWKVTAAPELVNERRPGAHFTFDSRKMNPLALTAIENLLYGSVSTTAGLPTIDDLLSPVTIKVVDNGDNTWSATGPDYLFTVPGPNQFQITEANAVYLDANTYVLSST